MEKIIVAVDLSDLAALVVETAASFAQAFNCRVHIVYVEAPSASYIGNEIVPPVFPIENEEELNRIKTDLKAMATHLQQKGIQTEYELIKGPVIETIIDKASFHNADMIVLGAHNHGFLYRALIGSVCSGVVKHSPCPVLIIPAK